MSTARIFVVESVSPEDFYNRRWEGKIVEEIVRLLRGSSVYKIVFEVSLLRKAIDDASKQACDIFHLSCHGNDEGICLTDGTDVSWAELAALFQNVVRVPPALILSSCISGGSGVTHAFKEVNKKPQVIFGAAAKGEDVLTFPGACVSWPILYTELVKRGLTKDVFKDAIKKMNTVTRHRFVYRRWDGNTYRRYPPH